MLYSAFVFSKIVSISSHFHALSSLLALISISYWLSFICSHLYRLFTPSMYCLYPPLYTVCTLRCVRSVPSAVYDLYPPPCPSVLSVVYGLHSPTVCTLRVLSILQLRVLSVLSVYWLYSLTVHILCVLTVLFDCLYSLCTDCTLCDSQLSSEPIWYYYQDVPPMHSVYS